MTFGSVAFWIVAGLAAVLIIYLIVVAISVLTARLQARWRRPRVREQSGHADAAWEMAIMAIRDCTRTLPFADGSERTVFVAGERNFKMPWARDTTFATGFLTRTPFAPVCRETAGLFLDFQWPDGELPVRFDAIRDFERVLRSLAMREQPEDRAFSPRKLTTHGTHSVDHTSLVLAGAADYAINTRDTDWGAERWPEIRQALEWLRARADRASALLVQEAYADWADSVDRSGVCMYSNTCYYRALKRCSEMVAMLGRPSEAMELDGLAGRVREGLAEQLWLDDRGFFANTDTLTNFASDGNLLAVVWGVADERQSASILQRCADLKIGRPVPSTPLGNTEAHLFDLRKISTIWKIADLGEYHMRYSWLWLGAVHALAAHRVGRTAEAGRLLDRMATVIWKHGGVWEVYNRSGRPARTRLYRAEVPFLWGASMYAWAASEIEGRPLEEVCPG